MNELTSLHQLKSQFLIADFAQKTLNQFRKDALTFIDVDQMEMKTTEFNEVVKKLTNIVKKIDHIGRLQGFIYRVDLDEKDWKQWLKTNDFNVLTEKILIREATKVYLREFFSQNK